MGFPYILVRNLSLSFVASSRGTGVLDFPHVPLRLECIDFVSSGIRGNCFSDVSVSSSMRHLHPQCVRFLQICPLLRHKYFLFGLIHWKIRTGLTFVYLTSAKWFAQTVVLGFARKFFRPFSTVVFHCAVRWPISAIHKTQFSIHKTQFSMLKTRFSIHNVWVCYSLINLSRLTYVYWDVFVFSLSTHFLTSIKYREFPFCQLVSRNF